MANNRRGNQEIEFKITSRVGILAEYQTGWTKELNIIAWNGGAPKYDIRDWDPDHEHMSKGITLHEDEARKLMSLLGSCFGWGCRNETEGGAGQAAGAKSTGSDAQKVGSFAGAGAQNEGAFAGADAQSGDSFAAACEDMPFDKPGQDSGSGLADVEIVEENDEDRIYA